MELPNDWGWDEHDMLLVDTEAEQAAARHADIVKAQMDSFSDDYQMALYTSDSVHMTEGRHEG